MPCKYRLTQHDIKCDIVIIALHRTIIFMYRIQGTFIHVSTYHK